MYLKDVSYLELWRPFGSLEQNHLCNFGRGYHEKQFFEFISNLGQWFRRRCWPSCSVEHNNLCNFERWHDREHSCAVILNLDQWYRRRCCLKKTFTDEGRWKKDAGRRPITIPHIEPSAQVS